MWCSSSMGNRGIGLRSVLLASFPQEPFIKKIYVLSLLDSHVAFTAECSHRFHPHQPFVVNWKTANGEAVNYPRRWLYPIAGPPGTMYLLPGNRILLASERFASMPFNFLSIQETRIPPPYYYSSGFATSTQWIHTVGFTQGLVSRPFYCSDSILFTFHTGDDISGLTIDDKTGRNTKIPAFPWHPTESGHHHVRSTTKPSV
ncbi:hypothetical protein M413DRAFT_267732 [Hebeloma cylindrosporum]|uniref:Uncharacterized protein n=1 Tax=Hebeloma cylindrosporum TaxID=76867 RepID=A0A0C3CDZ5_HEBCY|nr:hypothetical protein M413DRAFT_267732 [Hebeloma cylindrosporum h7]